LFVGTFLLQDTLGMDAFHSALVSLPLALLVVSNEGRPALALVTHQKPRVTVREPLPRRSSHLAGEAGSWLRRPTAVPQGQNTGLTSVIHHGAPFIPPMSHPADEYPRLLRPRWRGRPEKPAGSNNVGGFHAQAAKEEADRRHHRYRGAVGSGGHPTAVMGSASAGSTDVADSGVTSVAASVRPSGTSSASPPATSSAPPTATSSITPTSAPMDCVKVSEGTQCLLSVPRGNAFVMVTDVQAQAQKVDPWVSGSTPMVITAFGAEGGRGSQTNGTTTSAGPAGDGGIAQTSTTVFYYAKTHSSPALYYFAGAHPPGGKGVGGTSTIVATENLYKDIAPCIDGYNRCTSTNTLALAGGGGGGGGGNSGVYYSGGMGGQGGKATATTSGPATDSGSKGGKKSGGGEGGEGGDEGLGRRGRPRRQAREAGQWGIGGRGGPAKAKDGPSDTPPWINVGDIKSIGEGGQGGEGMWAVDGLSNGSGGGGGGGYGGGGGGAGGAT
ncbi:hypothetical protein AB0C70_44100, partial [Streptomyces sp. NPDC048564]